MKSNFTIIICFFALPVLFAQNFTEAPKFSSLDWVSVGSISFADVDGDGDEDVLITGRDNSSVRISKLYANDGTGSFTEMMGTPFDGVYNGSVAFSDVDVDGDEDVLITGLNNSSVRISKLYINVGPSLLSGEQCANAESVQNLFGGPENESQTSGLFDNTGYTVEGDTTNCFPFDNLDATRWFSFTGDG
ncbi:MAG: FG-GAP-like repeat-containing protein, partial [Bacteroidota bacterium]